MATLFEEEIRSQGEVVRRRAESGREQAQRVASSWRDIRYALVAARGSSDNAAVFFQYLAGRELGLVVALATPSLYGGGTMNLADAGVLGISQSGRTPGIAEVVREAGRQGRPHAAITNDEASPLADAADVVMELRAGAERAIASTKTFTATCHALVQLVSALKGEPLAGLEELDAYFDEVIQAALGATLPVELLDPRGGLTVVGRGVGQAVAAEVSLKIREVTGIRAEHYSAADYLHGPIGADGKDSTLLVALTEETTDDVATEVLSECGRVGMRTVVLREETRASVGGDAEVLVPRAASSWSAGLAQVIVGQVLALRLGERRGRPIDTAPGLRKVTTAA